MTFVKLQSCILQLQKLHRQVLAHDATPVSHVKKSITRIQLNCVDRMQNLEDHLADPSSNNVSTMYMLILHLRCSYICHAPQKAVCSQLQTFASSDAVYIDQRMLPRRHLRMPPSTRRSSCAQANIHYGSAIFRTLCHPRAACKEELGGRCRLKYAQEFYRLILL